MTPGDGSAAVPSEPRRMYRARRCRDYGELHGVVDGCHCDMNEGFDVVTVEEVGPVSEAEVEAGARGLCKFVFGQWDGLKEATKDDARNRARAVLSAAREVKSDG